MELIKEFCNWWNDFEDEGNNLYSTKFTEIAKTINGMESVDEGHNLPKNHGSIFIISDW